MTCDKFRDKIRNYDVFCQHTKPIEEFYLMDTKKIRELAEVLNVYDLTRLKLQDEGSNVSITLERIKHVSAPAAAPSAISTQTFDTALSGKYQTVETAIQSDDANEVKSPMIGVFYVAQSDGGTPFVSIGSKVKKGDVLCIIESMKLMNDIISERDGEITDIYVSNGDVVEFGQALFKLES